MKTSRHIAGLVLAVGLCANLAHGQGWALPQWKYRRTVTVPDYKPTRLPGQDIAVVDMPTGGLVRRDGRDIRVYAGERETPHRVLMVGPGDTVRLAFGVYGTMPAYSVYFGNPAAPAPTRKLQIQRGVLLEMWQYPGGIANRLSQAQRVIGQANKIIGRGFRPNVFLGHNPFGPQDRVASRFTAWFVAPSGGTYTFAASSRNASFLLVDDKDVVSNGGWHGPQRDIRMRNTISLTKGLHKLTFYHISPRSDPICVAAWQAPGDKRVWVMPAKAFAPVFRGVPGAIKEYGKSFAIDFIPVHGNESFMMDRYFQRWEFKAAWSGVGGSRATWTWDFGDGQKARGATVQHVYLLPGLYPVTLTTRLGTLPEMTRTHRIYVTRPWDKVTQTTLDSIRQHATIVSTYDFTTLAPAATVWAMRLLERTGNIASLLRAGKEFCTLRQAPAESIAAVVPLYADHLVAKGNVLRAVGSLQKAATMTKDPAVCAQMLVKAGQLYLLERGRSKDAMGLFTTVIQRYSALTRSSSIREARMGIGDVYRAQGELAKARAAYEKAHVGGEAAGTRAPIIKGDFARHVEDYTRLKDYESAWDYLAKWEQTFPLDKLEGYWSLLKVRLLLAEGKDRPAIMEAEILAGVNPTSQYAAELLMLAATTYRKISEPAKCRETLSKIVEKYPESPLAPEAAKMLRGR